MLPARSKILKAALAALHYSRADELIAPFTSGEGVIFMLHHVVPDDGKPFSPSRILKVTPEFLDSVIRQVREAGFDIISIDDVRARLSRLADGGTQPRPFAVFTLDDGYKDNRDYAYPIFKAHNVPFTIYVPSDFADGQGELWWLLLEQALDALPAVVVTMDGVDRAFQLETPEQKETAYDVIYWWLRSQPEDLARATVRRLASDAGIEPHELCRQLVMSWDELRDLARDPLVTIGAHTIGHYALGKLSADEARRQMSESVRRIERELGRPCRHFSYPYGCEASAAEREFAMAEELGLDTAVTTRKGLLYARDHNALGALPRFSLNGDYQDNRYVKVLLSGAPFALMRAFKRVANLPAASTGRVTDRIKRRAVAST